MLHLSGAGLQDRFLPRQLRTSGLHRRGMRGIVELPNAVITVCVACSTGKHSMVCSVAHVIGFPVPLRLNSLRIRFYIYGQVLVTRLTVDDRARRYGLVLITDGLIVESPVPSEI